MGFEKKMSTDGRRVGKAPERSNFTQYCNVLSQLLKEKRGSGSLGLGFSGKIESKGAFFTGFSLFSLILVSGFCFF